MRIFFEKIRVFVCLVACLVFFFQYHYSFFFSIKKTIFHRKEIFTFKQTNGMDALNMHITIVMLIHYQIIY